MINATDQPQSHPLDLTEDIRKWNNLLCLWRLCRTGKCYKTRACKGAETRRCFEAHFTLVPDKLIAWANELAEAGREGLSIDEALERLKGTHAENALEEWYEALRYSEAILKAKNLEWAPPPEEY